MRLHQITRGRVLEGKPAHPGNPNPAMATNADEQAKAKAGSAAERDAQIDREKAAEKGPGAGTPAPNAKPKIASGYCRNFKISIPIRGIQRTPLWVDCWGNS